MELHAPGFHYAGAPRQRPPFRSTLGNYAEIEPQAIATAIRAVMNGIIVIDRAIAQLERSTVSAADVLLERVEHAIDFTALDKAQEGIARLEALLGPEGTVLYEGGDHAVSALREQVDTAAAVVAPYQKRRKKP